MSWDFRVSVCTDCATALHLWHTISASVSRKQWKSEAGRTMQLCGINIRICPRWNARKRATNCLPFLKIRTKLRTYEKTLRAKRLLFKNTRVQIPPSPPNKKNPVSLGRRGFSYAQEGFAGFFVRFERRICVKFSAYAPLKTCQNPNETPNEKARPKPRLYSCHITTYS